VALRDWVREMPVRDNTEDCPVCGAVKDTPTYQATCDRCLNNRCWDCGKAVAPGGKCCGHQYTDGRREVS